MRLLNYAGDGVMQINRVGSKNDYLMVEVVIEIDGEVSITVPVREVKEVALIVY